MKYLIPSFLILAACSAKQANIAEDKITEDRVQKFEVSSISQVSNKVFLWKPESKMKAAEVAQVQRLSTELDQTEMKMEELEQPLKVFQRQYEALLKDLNEENQQLVSDLNDIVSRRREKIGSLEKRLLDERSKQEPDQKRIEKWERDLLKAQAELQEAAEQRRQLVPGIDDALKLIEEEQIKIAEPKKNLEDQASAILNQITSTVDLYEKSPTAVQFELGSNSIYGRVAWALNETAADNDFTTENGGLVDVSYNKVGGVLKFTLINKVNGEEMKFKVARTDLNNRLGRVIYSGSLQLRKSNGERRQGVAKFADRNF